MEKILPYVKDIAYLLIFISFITILLPSDKYKKYINLIMGLVIIIVVLNPIRRIISKEYAGYKELFSGIELNLDKEIINKEKGYYEKEQLSLIIDTYKDNLNAQLENIISNQGYKLSSSKIDINIEDDNFGEIEGIWIEIIEDDSKNKEKPKKLIKIEKIEIKPQISSKEVFLTDFDTEKETEEIKNLKIYISNFYNLSVDNIYITVAQN